MGSLFETAQGEQFFVEVSGKYLEQAVLHFKGKLFGDWNNVARHCLIQAAAVEELGELLGFPADVIDQMARVAIMHDARKRIDKWECAGKKTNEFTKEEVREFDVLFAEVNPAPDLVSALSSWFLPKVLLGKVSFFQLVQFLVDDMAKGEEIVPFDERIDEVSARNPNPDPEVEKLLGRPYWDVEREIGHRVIAMIAAILKARYVFFDESNHGKALADLVNHGILKRIREVK